MNSEKSRTHFAVLNITSNFIGYFFNSALGFVCRMIFVRVLTADYLGLNGLFSNIIMMLSLTELGIGGVITYALYEPLAKNDKPKTAALLKFFAEIYRIIGILVAVFGILLIPFLDFFIKDVPSVNENITLIYLLFLFSSAFSYFFSHKLSLLRASQKDYIVLGTNYIVTIIQSALQIAFLLWTKDYMTYIYIQTVGGICYYLWLSYIVKKQYGDLTFDRKYVLDKSDKRALLRNVWQLSVGKLGGLLVNSTDNLIIAYLMNVATVGLLSNYILLTKTLDNLTSKLLISASSGIGNFNAIEQKSKTKDLFYNINFLIFVLYAWISIEIVIVANDMVNLLFGAGYVMSWNISAILAINFYMVGMQSVIWTFRNSLGIFKRGQYLLLLTALINLVLSFILGAKFGVFGVLVSTAIARLLTNWWYHPILLFKYGFGEKATGYFNSYFKFLAFTIVAASISYALCKNLLLPLVYNVLIKSVIGSLVFFFLLFLFFRNRSEFGYVKQKIVQAFILGKQMVLSIIYKNN